MVEEVGLFITGERTLETPVLEGLARWPGNVVGPFRLAFLGRLHLDFSVSEGRV